MDRSDLSLFMAFTDWLACGTNQCPTSQLKWRNIHITWELETSSMCVFASFTLHFGLTKTERGREREFVDVVQMQYSMFS